MLFVNLNIELNVNKPICFLIGLFFICTTTISQSFDTKDSLKNELSKEEVSDLDKAEIIQQISRIEQNKDSIFYYASLLLELSQQYKLQDKMHSAYIDLGSMWESQGNLEKALEYYILSLSCNTKESSKGASYSNIANVYSTNKDYDKALENYKKAIELFWSIPDSLRLGTTAISLGYTFYVLDNLDSATKYSELAKLIFSTIDYEYSEYYWAYAEGNLALVIARKGEFVEAETSLNTALKILKNYADDYAICDYDFQLSKIYFERGEVERGLQKAVSSYERANKNGFKEFIRDGSEILSQFYSELGDHKKAFDYQSTFLAYKDSLFNADLIRKLADQQKEYEVNQKQSELDVITAEQKAERVILWATAGFAFVLFILAFTIFKYYRAKSKVNQILEAQKVELQSLNSTKDKFFSIISHDLRGPISSFFGISRMIKFFVKSKETDQLLEVADDIDQSVEQLSKLLDNLLSWAVQQQGGFPNNPEKLKLNEVSDSILGTFSTLAQGKNISLTAKIEEGLEVWADRKMVETIFRNLVNNALKFTPEKGQVTIEAMREDNQSHIQIIDTGVGIPQDRLDELFKLQAKKSTYGTSGEKGLGLGLQLAYEFVASNSGKMEVESKEDEGTIFHVYFPLHHSSDGMN